MSDAQWQLKNELNRDNFLGGWGGGGGVIKRTGVANLNLLFYVKRLCLESGRLLREVSQKKFESHFLYRTEDPT